ncbi:MAG: hypothetical protein ABI572_04505 [Actinomycetota bacterium]
MNRLEWAASAVLGLAGLRSLVHWMRRPFDGTEVADHLLFAAFVLGRVGSWWSLAGLFALSANTRNPDPLGGGATLAGRAFVEEFRARSWWYPLVVLGCLVLQFLAGFFLGRRPVDAVEAADAADAGPPRGV